MKLTMRNDQPELFDISEAPPRPRPGVLGVIHLQLRHDQAIIGGIAGLIGLTIIFAMGVERGKQLARAERSWLPIRAELPTATPEVAVPVGDPLPEPASEVVPDAPAGQAGGEPTQKAAPSTPKPVSAPTRSRYAVQVVTYSRPQLARAELQRLQDTGEQAFLHQQRGRTVLMVGPFPTKSLAREKSTTLKGRYGDCFVRSL